DDALAESPGAGGAREAVVVAAGQDRLEREGGHRLEDREVRPCGGGAGGLVHVDDEIRDDVLRARGAVVQLDDRERRPDFDAAMTNRASGAAVARVREERCDSVEVAGVEAFGVGVDEAGDGVAAGHGESAIPYSPPQVAKANLLSIR